MSKKSDTLVSLLLPFGLSSVEADLYLSLRGKSSSTALELSRKLSIPRTKVYKILDSLVHLGLVNIRLDSRGQRFEAMGKEQLEAIIALHELETKNMKKNIQVLEEHLLQVPNFSQSQSKVLYYHGVEGLKQVTWNSLRAKGELMTFEIANMNAFFDNDYAEDMRLRFLDKKINIRTLTNAEKIGPWTNVAQEMVEKYWEIRHISKKQMRVNFEILIYNDVYVLYRYQDNDIFCVEIYNKELAEMQKQLFEFIWKFARKFKVLNNRGQAVLV